MKRLFFKEAGILKITIMFNDGVGLTKDTICKYLPMTSHHLDIHLHNSTVQTNLGDLIERAGYEPEFYPPDLLY